MYALKKGKNLNLLIGLGIHNACLRLVRFFVIVKIPCEVFNIVTRRNVS